MIATNRQDISTEQVFVQNGATELQEVPPRGRGPPAEGPGGGRRTVRATTAAVGPGPSTVPGEAWRWVEWYEMISKMSH